MNNTQPEACSVLGLLMTQYHSAIAADCAEDQLRDLLASVKGGV